VRSVIVTGGSRGVGLAIVVGLAGAGYDVVAVARRESEQLRAEIERARETDAGAVSFTPFDFANVEAIPDFVRRLKSDFGPPTSLARRAARTQMRSSCSQSPAPARSASVL